MLRALATWGAIAAVAGVGVAAFVDELRPHRDAGATQQATSRPSVSERALPEQLREAGVRGVLVYADEGCRLRALRLPNLDPAEVPEAVGSTRRSPGTEAVEAGCMLPPPTAPAGPPTFVERGRILQLVTCPREGICRRVLLSRRDLARAASHPFVPEGSYAARDLVRLSGDRLAILVRGGYPGFVAVFRGGTFLYRMFSGFEPRSLRASPLGRYVVVDDDGGPHVVRAGRAPRNVSFPPGLTTVHEVAWSADERWLALATRASIWFLSLEEPDAPLVRLPLEAREIGWYAS